MTEGTSVIREFEELTEEERVQFVGQTLDMMVQYSRSGPGIKKLVKWFAPLLFSAVKPPTDQELNTINQFVTIFTYSLKEEFRYKWAELIHNLYKFKTKQLVPELTNLPQRQKEVENMKWVHAGITAETYQKLYVWLMNNSISNWDDAFNTMLNAIEHENLNASHEHVKHKQDKMTHDS